MSTERIKLIVILSLVLLNIAVLMSGCALVERVVDAVFDTESKELVIPETPKEQLWQTIKGLTPNWLAIPVIALGAAVIWNGKWKIGMTCVIFGSTNLFLALATSRFGFWMALCGFIGTCAALAASILEKNKALKEMVFGIQSAKRGFKKDHNDIVVARITNAQSNIQTESTKKIVAKIKTKAKLRGEI